MWRDSGRQRPAKERGEKKQQQRRRRQQERGGGGAAGPEGGSGGEEAVDGLPQDQEQEGYT